MSRLTRKNETIDKPYLEMCDLEMSFRHPSMYSTNCYTGKAVNKLSALEDVLEEFGIESAEELRERLAKAIIPKFETRQNVFAIFDDAYYDECGVCEGIIEEFTVKRSDRREYYICSKERSFFVDEEYIFTTEAEAQAKFDELKQGGEKFGRLKN